MTTIPKIVHFVFGFKEQKNEFSLLHHIAVLSASKILKPDVIHFHCFNKPHGIWWDRTSPLINYRQLNDEPIYWGTTPIIKTEHKADYHRLHILLNEGGIYLDIDTICVKPVDDLLNNCMVMGIEHINEGDNVPLLCNAIMMSIPNSTFIKIWIEKYPHYFNPDEWAYCSVYLPGMIYTYWATDHITVLPKETFFWPGCREADLIWNTHSYIHDTLRIQHLWENCYSPNVTIDYIKKNECRYTSLAQPLLPFIDIFNTYDTKYGKLTLYKNETYITPVFERGEYWDDSTLLRLKQFIDPNRNIIEIGAHSGTSTVFYANCLNEGRHIYAYEPQKNMYSLLVKNVCDNNLQSKVKHKNTGLFCFNGKGAMNNIDLDGGGGDVSKRYNDEVNLQCNFGGIGLGKDGESIDLITLDDEKLTNIGYIHIDAQGAEPFIFSKAIYTITQNRPVIFYENNEVHGRYLFDSVCRSYPNYYENSLFNIKKFCMETLKYSTCIDNFNGGIDTLLIP